MVVDDTARRLVVQYAVRKLRKFSYLLPKLGYFNLSSNLLPKREEAKSPKEAVTRKFYCCDEKLTHSFNSFSV